MLFSFSFKWPTVLLALLVYQTAALSTRASDLPPQVVSKPPLAVNATSGQDLVLAVSANSENQPLSYQWNKNNRPLSGATQPGLTLSNFTKTDAGIYRLRITDSLGLVTNVTSIVRPAAVFSNVVSWGQNSSGQTNVPLNLSDAVAVAAGDDHSVALKVDGSVALWGDGDYGQLDLPLGYTGFVAVAAGATHTLALKMDGTVVAWGRNNTGQCNVPAGLSDVVAVAAGSNNSYALKADGTVVGWGQNSYSSINIPAGLTDVVSIAAGSFHVLALRADGTVVAWGNNANGAATVPAGLSGVVAVAARGLQSEALKSDGTVVAWGFTNASVPAGATNIESIALGWNHRAALKMDGSVLVWGSNLYRQRTPPAGLSNVVAIAAGGNHTLALRDATGDTVPSFIVQPVSAFGAVGASHTLAVTAGGWGPFAYQWRKNGVDLPGQTTATLVLGELKMSDAGNYDVIVTNHVGSATSIAAALTIEPPPVVTARPADWVAGVIGHPLNLAVTATSANQPLTFQWSRNNRPIAGATQSTLVLPAFNNRDAGAYTLLITDSHNLVTRVTCFVRPAPILSQIIAWGDNGSEQVTVPANLQNVVSVAAGGAHSVTLKADGTVVAWGGNSAGQVTIPENLTNVVQVAASRASTVALKADGTVAAWGRNLEGEATVPVGLNQVVAVQAGDGFAVALKADGTVASWGGDGFGQTAIPAGLGAVVDIAVGDYHTLALKNDGTVVAWGYNISGQTNVPSGLGNVVAVAAGTKHSVALKADGTIVAWGDGQNSLVPSSWVGVVKVVARSDYTYAFKGDGSVLISNAVPPEGLTNVVELAVGYSHALALKDVRALQAITFPVLTDIAYTASPIGLLASADSGLPVDFSVVSGPATVASSQLIPSGLGLVVVRATQVGNNEYMPATAVERSFTIRGSFDWWRAASFTAAELSNPAISGANANMTDDGFSNLVKYALDMPLVTGDGALLPVITADAANWIYTYSRPTDRPDITYQVEISTDMVTWSASGVNHALISQSGERQTWQATYPLAAAGKVFFRLKVTRN